MPRVPVKVVWQETTQFSAIVEIEIEKGQSGDKAGRRKVREDVGAAIDELDEEARELDETFAGNRNFVSLKPIWDAVEPGDEQG